MGKKLVIVESPAKARTIGQYLGSEFDVRSSMGHVRDLPKKGMSVDIDNDFEPTYEIAPDKIKIIKELKQALKAADSLWLATDEDREGEAIAWHLCFALGLKPNQAQRVVFHEITKPAIQSAIEKPRPIDQNLVNAQQARRILDRLVGYELSPLLWKKIQTGLSAGRVQSVAVRLIVDREREILGFIPTSTYKIVGQFKAAQETFNAELVKNLDSETGAKQFLEAANTAVFKVEQLNNRPATSNPPAPFITSTLQQTASRLLSFSVRQTMVVAQQLYEAGHITYMRTDSLSLAQSALTQAAAVIKERWGDDYYQARTYKTKSRLAQEAHEAIRPTDFKRPQIEGDAGQQRLYELIYKRTLATQMKPAQIEKSEIIISISNRPETLKASGEVLKFEGYLLAYDLEARAEDRLLPALKLGQDLSLMVMRATQTYSRPKARYTEATLVRKLESLGIGRPSTYAPTISTIQDRGYVGKTELEGETREAKTLQLQDGKISEASESQVFGADRNKLAPSQTGEVVTDFLVKHFGDIVDYRFTAGVEADFDNIASGKKDWRALLKAFYQQFHPVVEKAELVSRQEATKMRELGKDPATGLPIFARLGRYGPIVQLGETESEQKPRFAPIPEALKIDNINLAEALKLLELPRMLGKTKDGEDIMVNVGPYGPYLKAGKTSVSIKGTDPFTIEATDANRLIEEKQEQAANKVIQDFKGSTMQILNGPYGPYITDGKRNAPVPKGEEPTKLTQETAQQILSAAPQRGRNRRRRPKRQR